MNVFIADGQLAATTTALIAVQAKPVTVGVSLFNSGAATETVYLTVTRGSGSARILATAILAPNEALYLQGLGLQPTDTLKGYASDASAVDYLVSQGSDSDSFVVYGRDASGAPKGASLVSDIRELLWKISPA